MGLIPGIHRSSAVDAIPKWITKNGALYRMATTCSAASFRLRGESTVIRGQLLSICGSTALHRCGDSLVKIHPGLHRDDFREKTIASERLVAFSVRFSGVIRLVRMTIYPI
jgi:hypothetical protein